MAEVFKLIQSSEVTDGLNPRTNPKWYARGYASDLAAVGAVFSAAASAGESTIGTMTIRNWTPTLKAIHPGPPVTYDYEVQLEYAPPTFGEIEATLDFGVGGGSIHMTQSLETVLSRNCTGFGSVTAPGPDYARAIGYDPATRRVQGVDVSDGGTGTEFTVKKVKPKDFLTGSSGSGKLRSIQALRWRTNDAAFFGAAIGEVRFLGMSGTLGGDNKFHLSFRFSWGTTQVQHINGANGSAGVTIPPHHYLWCLYQPQLTGSLGLMVPAAVYVERLFDPGDFSIMELT